MKKIIAAVVLLIAAAAAPAQERSSELVKQFKETHTCPATGKMAVKGSPSSYTCPGYVVDHGIPYCAGQYIGRSMDQLYNMSYQKHDAANSFKKDADEDLLCITLKKYIKPVTQAPGSVKP